MLLGAALIASPAAAAPPNHKKLGSGARDYWTTKRMAKAVPLDAGRTVSASNEPQPRSHPSFLSEPVPDPAAPPYPANGKVFLRLGGNGYYCSASIVDAASLRLVWTAAHCLRDQGRHGQWARKWLFVPGYQQGSRPYGTWRAGELWVSKPWVTRRASENVDWGAAIIKRQNGVGVQTAVGAAYPLGANQPREQTWEAVGYPAAARFEDRLWHCVSAFHGSDNATANRPGPAPIGIGCDTTGGESGGPWISEAGALGAVTSYGYTNAPDVMYGSYLGRAAARLYARMQSR